MSRWPGNPQRELTTFGGLSRGQLMARVRSTGNQTTEQRLAMLLRRMHVTGWRRHQPIAGRPDFTWLEVKVAVFLDGCFWHGHNCGRNVTPKTNATAWREKIRRNKQRDQSVNRSLRRRGWSVLRIWECNLAKDNVACMKRIQRALEGRRMNTAGDSE